MPKDKRFTHQIAIRTSIELNSRIQIEAAKRDLTVSDYLRTCERIARTHFESILKWNRACATARLKIASEKGSA